jgi:CubicO group peptidase (beta-lactamase class C family)
LDGLTRKRRGTSWQGLRFGSSLIVAPSPFDHRDARGELYSGGMAGTQWWISPKANVAVLMMTQRQEAFAHPAAQFKRLAYEAVTRKS